MKNKNLVIAAQYIKDFCSETACPECCIKKLCNAKEKNLPLSDQIRRAAEQENLEFSRERRCEVKAIMYDSGRPLMRLEKGDKAVISVSHFSFANDKDKERYKDIPSGNYEAVCVDYLRLECERYPILSGRYNYWRGERWGCSEGIYADEVNPEN